MLLLAVFAGSTAISDRLTHPSRAERLILMTQHIAQAMTHRDISRTPPQHLQHRKLHQKPTEAMQIPQQLQSADRMTSPVRKLLIQLPRSGNRERELGTPIVAPLRLHCNNCLRACAYK